jgi:L-methionine (R)-S-oxide reductase
MEQIIKTTNLGPKQQRYKELLPQVKALLASEKNMLSKMANLTAILKNSFDWLWVGFYIVDKDSLNELMLGPFQGPVACFRIQKGRGVCGAAWQEKRTIVVPNVHEFPGHIACSALSNSEIVLPVLAANAEVIAVLDIDSKEFNCFDDVDVHYLNLLLKTLL